MSRVHYMLDRRHVLECERMVSWSDVQADPKATVKSMYSNLWKILPELVWASRTPWDEILQHMPAYQQCLDYIRHQHQNKGIVFVTGHLGNWELCGWMMSHCHSPMLSVYKQPKRRWVHDLLAAMRSSTQQLIIEKEGALMKLYKTICRGGIIGLVIDQYGGPTGKDSQFLGRPCKSWDSAVQLAHRSKCPLMLVTLTRNKKGFDVNWTKDIGLVLDAAGQLDATASVLKLDQSIEAMVRAYPDQWMWLGRRWGRDFDKTVAKT